MTGAGTIIEVQGTAEKTPFTEEQLLALLALAAKAWPNWSTAEARVM